MGRIVLHQKDNLLELDSLFLHTGDRIECLLLGSWVAGEVAHDPQGWYLLTRDNVGIRLQTGLISRLLSLSLDAFFMQRHPIWRHALETRELQSHPNPPRAYSKNVLQID
jgi:hypothetical protein